MNDENVIIHFSQVLKIAQITPFPNNFCPALNKLLPNLAHILSVEENSPPFYSPPTTIHIAVN